MGRLLFSVVDVFVLKVGRVVLATECPLQLVPTVKVGDPVEFRNPDGSVFQSVVAGIELSDPPSLNQPFTFPLPSGTRTCAVQVGAEVWSLAEDTHT